MSDCGACGASADRQEELARITGQPVFCNVLWSDSEQARAATLGEITLVLCHGCGAMRNADFDPDLAGYALGYENSLMPSVLFRGFAEDLVQRLVATYRLSGKTVLEVGSGRGEFLRLLLDAGVARGVGYDPSVEPWDDGRLRLVAQSYPLSPDAMDADFVFGRHVLEHLTEPVDPLRGLRCAIGDRIVPGYFEVPDAGYMVQRAAVWDIIYEHPWYFSESALRALMARAGFRTTGSGTAFGGQFLWAEVDTAAVEAVPAGVPAGYVRSARQLAVARRDLVDGWSARLVEASRTGRGVALWGAGSKGVTFLNGVEGADGVRAVVDLNPRKHGRFVPGTGHQVSGPESLLGNEIATVVVANPNYVAEVERDLVALDISAEVVAL